MKIEIYADLLCGWGYVAWAQLERALTDPAVRQLAIDRAVEIWWRPYLIDPAAPAPSEPLSKVLEEPDTAAALQSCSPGLSTTAARERLSSFASATGLTTPWRQAWRTSSWAAHRLVQDVGARHGSAAQRRAVRDLFSLHFDDGADINRLTVLRELAHAWQVAPPVDGPADGFAAVFMQPLGPRHDVLEDTTRDALLFGRASGVTSSPTFVVDGTVTLLGAQGHDVVAELIVDAAHSAGSARLPLPEEVRRLRAAQALLDLRDPLGCLRLLAPLRDQWGDRRDVTELAARAMAAAAMLGPARDLLLELVAADPSDAALQELLGRTLRRLGSSGPTGHERLSRAMTT